MAGLKHHVQPFSYAEENTPKIGICSFLCVGEHHFKLRGKWLTTYYLEPQGSTVCHHYRHRALTKPASSSMASLSCGKCLRRGDWQLHLSTKGRQWNNRSGVSKMHPRQCTSMLQGGGNPGRWLGGKEHESSAGMEKTNRETQGC